MAETTALHDRIAGIFSAGLHLEVPSIHTDLFDSGVLDSLAFVELLLQLEREFGITTSVDDLEVENFRSIHQIADFIQARTSVSATTPRHSRVIELGARR